MTEPTPGAKSLAGRRIVIVVNTDWFFLSHRLPLALAAAAEGSEVWVVATDTGRADEIRGHGLRFEDARISRGSGNPLHEAVTLVHLTRLLRRLRPDMVHLVATKAIVYGGLAARLVGVRGVVCAVTGAGYALGEGRNPVLQRLVRGLLRVVLRPASVVIFQHDADVALYVGHGLLRPGHALLVRGVGVDVDIWCPQPEPIQPVVMLAGRMIEEKGVGTFAEAARLLRPVHPDVRFVLVGQLEKDLPTGVPLATLEAWVVEGLVEWWGYRSDMRGVLAACTVLVLPTFHNEGVPKVLVEAGALQRAVVASDIPGCRAVVEPGVTGLLVPVREPAQLAAAVDALLKDPVMRHRLARAARADVVKRFREGDLTALVLAAYRAAVSEERSLAV